MYDDGKDVDIVKESYSTTTAHGSSVVIYIPFDGQTFSIGEFSPKSIKPFEISYEEPPKM